MRSSIVIFATLLAVPASATADPDAPSATLFSTSGTPLLRLDLPKLPPVSLRLEAARVAGEQFGASWRYPEPGNLVALDGNAWFVGAGYYRPRSVRSAALHGGSIATTILGEVLLSAGSPVAGLGALLTGATLDAAAADSDRDAEARRPR